MTVLGAASLVIGLGGNVGDVRTTFDRARAGLAQLGSVRSAPLYRSEPIGPAQPEFWNTAVCITCRDATPSEVLATLRELEYLLGRDRRLETRWGPRAIDLDVLLWGSREIRTPELEVPHPRLTQRRFVIDPLVALFGPDLEFGGQTLADLARAVASQRVELVAETW